MSSSITAARLHEHNKALTVETVELADATDREVRVKLAYAGVNPIDRYGAEGKVSPDGPLPRTLGSEASGYVDGKPVVVNGGGLGASRDGLYATAANVPLSSVVELPDGIDMRCAASVAIAGLTAWNVVTEKARVTSEDRVLVLGSGGGVGLPIVSLAASIGATVWGQVGQAFKEEAVRKHGAGNVIVCDADGLGEALGDFKPTVVIDPLGGKYTTNALLTIAAGGRLALFGTSSGLETSLNLQNIYRNGLSIVGYSAFQLTEEQRRTGLVAAIAALADGRMQIPIHDVTPLADINNAFAALSERSVIGNLVVDLT